MEFAKEKKRHLTYLSKIRPRSSEIQNVLTFTVQEFTNDTRLEYMAFVEKNTLHHSWAALLAFWRYRHHTDTDKSAITAMKRKMEIKKKEEYTLYHNTKCLKKQHSSPPPITSPVAATSTETTPSPPSSPPKKKDSPTNILTQKLIMRMSPRDWYEFLLTHNTQAANLLPDLRKFLHTKYINEENTHNRDKYGKLCNLAEYPLTYRPYEEDFSTKRKLTFDPSSPHDQPKFRQPSTFINREFSGSHFPVYMSEDEYTTKCLTPQPFRLPCGYLTETIPDNPPSYKLYRINEGGKMVEVI